MGCLRVNHPKMKRFEAIRESCFRLYWWELSRDELAGFTVPLASSGCNVLLRKLLAQPITQESFKESVSSSVRGLVTIGWSAIRSATSSAADLLNSSSNPED